jgi:hypothetical protein
MPPSAWSCRRPPGSVCAGGSTVITTGTGVAPHRYALADFGLDRAVVDQRFARYREWVAAVT